jgi:hypothetical protein
MRNLSAEVTLASIVARQQPPERSDHVFAGTPLGVLDRWLQLSPEVKAAAVWQSLARSPQAGHLTELLQKLQRSDPTVEKALAALMRQVAHAMADDRVLADDQARQPGLTRHEIEQLARQVFRRARIDAIAAARVVEVNAGLERSGSPWHTEEIETHLAYVSGLHESLKLGGLRPAALYTQTFRSMVEAQHLEQARAMVESDEAEQFEDFLSLWQPWQDFVRSRLPEPVAQFEETLSSIEFDRRMDAEAAMDMRATGLDPETDHSERARLVKDRSQQAVLEGWRSLTRSLRGQRPD